MEGSIMVDQNGINDESEDLIFTWAVVLTMLGIVVPSIVSLILYIILYP